MIKIISESDVSRIVDSKIALYVENLIHRLLKDYEYFCPNRSIETIGAIFLLESADEIKNYQEMGLTNQVKKSQFEWIADVGDYYNCCIVLDNDFAVNIIGKKEYFAELVE